MNIQKLKTQIKYRVDEINCVKHLSEINGYLNKQIIESKIQKAFDYRRIASPDNISWFTNLILFKSNASLYEKLQFCDMLMDPFSLIDSEYILNSQILYLDRIGSITRTQVFHDIKIDVMNATHLDCFSTSAIGKGEVFLVIFGNNISKGKTGDLNVSGHELEMKGIGANIYGAKGYTAPRNVDVVGMLNKRLRISFDSKKMSFTKWQAFNNALDKSRVSNFEVVATFRDIFTLMYTESVFEEVYFEYIPKILPKARLCLESKLWLTAMQLDYYKRVDKFDSILFLRAEDFKAIQINNIDEFIECSELFKIQPFCWTGSGSRHSTNQVTFIG